VIADGRLTRLTASPHRQSIFAPENVTALPRAARQSAPKRRGFVIENGLVHQDGLSIAARRSESKPVPQAA